MTRADTTKFRFRRHDRVGANAAEDDADFLAKCFVDTGDLDRLLDPVDTRVVVLGRTGSGKSALLGELVRRKTSSVIALKPENLALSYLSNSTILRFFEDAGVNLDPLFKLLWRHVLAVEILNRHLAPGPEQKDGGLFETLRSRFSSSTVGEKRGKEAVDFLSSWGETFWQETEYRTKEITGRIESELGAALAGKIDLSLLETSTAANLLGRVSEEEREEIVTRGQAIVAKAQVQDLQKVLDLISAVLEDRQQVYYVTIDQLDDNWVEERLRYKLIMALILTAREFLSVENAKVVLAIRRDLVERVFRMTRASGFQEEKFHSLYLPLEWTKKDLIRLLDERFAALVESRYTGKSVTHRDLLPPKVHKVKIDDYLFERAQRPRDLIAFANSCIDAAEAKSKVTTSLFRTAEGEWSGGRLRALGDEWAGDYPRLLDFAALLERRPSSFKMGLLTDDLIEEFCLQRAAERPDGRGLLQSIALQVVNLVLPPAEARRQIIKIFYLVGLVGLKLSPQEAESWVDQLGRGVPTAEIGPDTSVVTHPAFHRALGIGDGSYRGRK